MYRHLTEIFNAKKPPNIRLIATDMDGTLTKNAKFTSSLFSAMVVYFLITISPILSF